MKKFNYFLMSALFMFSLGSYGDQSGCPSINGLDLTQPDNLTLAFQRLKCVADCSLKRDLFRKILNNYFGSNQIVSFSNETIDFPFQIQKKLINIIDATVSGSAKIHVKKMGFSQQDGNIQVGDIDVSQCDGTGKLGGKTVTIQNNQMEVELTVNDPAVNVGVDFLNQSWLGLVGGSLGLSTDIKVLLSFDMAINENSDGTVGLNATIPVGSIQVTPSLQCTNNLKLGAGGTAVADVAIGAAACAASLAACPIAGPAAIIAFPTALDALVQSSLVCGTIQNEFNSFMNQQKIASLLEPKINNFLGNKVCNVIGGAFGMSCSSAH